MQGVHPPTGQDTGLSGSGSCLASTLMQPTVRKDSVSTGRGAHQPCICKYRKSSISGRAQTCRDPLIRQIRTPTGREARGVQVSSHAVESTLTFSLCLSLSPSHCRSFSLPLFSLSPLSSERGLTVKAHAGVAIKHPITPQPQLGGYAVFQHPQVAPTLRDNQTSAATENKPYLCPRAGLTDGNRNSGDHGVYAPCHWRQVRLADVVCREQNLLHIKPIAGFTASR